MRLMIKFVNYLFVKKLEHFRWFSTKASAQVVFEGQGGWLAWWTSCEAWLVTPPSATLLIIINCSP